MIISCFRTRGQGSRRQVLHSVDAEKDRGLIPRGANHPEGTDLGGTSACGEGVAGEGSGADDVVSCHVEHDAKTARASATARTCSTAAEQ